jgi:hypothetical protein
MLYDVFICHASEDKDSFVRPLAEALRRDNVAVWYDEFTLKLGDSIRRSLDRGLKQSRFGVVVLSEAFFNKNWPQWELDGLAEREMMGEDKVILPVWHGVNYSDVKRYSLPLAGRKAALSSDGIVEVVDAILAVVHPQDSPLIVARDTLLEWGITPPVITDQYWLQVTEASNRLPGFGAMIPEESTWDRWSFPLPPKGETAGSWGERLAWTAMQMQWVRAADRIPISPLTEPSIVLEFIHAHSGLFEICAMFPTLTAEYAPQLTIKGMGGELEKGFEELYQKSVEEHLAARRANSRQGSGLTINGLCPLCDEDWALRHLSFGDYEADHVAEEYFNGGMFGPQVSPYHPMDHVVWLLSSASSWLPAEIREYLVKGMKNCLWQWGRLSRGIDHGGDWPSNGTLLNVLHGCLDKGTRFRWTEESKDDARNRIKLCAQTLRLPESVDELYDLFVQHKFSEHYLAAERTHNRRRSNSSATTPSK